MSSDSTLGKARGLNSIANPSDFKGSRGRRARARTEEPVEEAAPAPSVTTAVPAAERAPAARIEPAEPPQARRESTVANPAPEQARPAAVPVSATPHRAVVPGTQRKRRELSVPVPVAEAVEATGINAADVVMTAYRNHSDAIFSGAGGRMVAKGRQRLRLSISDSEFDKLTRLGEARGWNRSETVTVLLTVALLESGEAAPSSHT